MADEFCLKMPDFHVTFRDLLHAVNLRHGTNGFTFLPKEGVLRIFFVLKNPTASAVFEPANLGAKGQHATSRPPKPLQCCILLHPLPTIFYLFTWRRLHVPNLRYQNSAWSTASTVISYQNIIVNYIKINLSLRRSPQVTFKAPCRQLQVRYQKTM